MSETPKLTNDDVGGSMMRLVRRDAYICKYCEGVYADEPVTSCDCLGHHGQKPPHFIKGKIEYRLPNDRTLATQPAKEDSDSK